MFSYEIKTFTSNAFFGPQYCKCTFWVWAMMTIVCVFEKLFYGKIGYEVSAEGQLKLYVNFG